jgi:hypothetical protein
MSCRAGRIVRALFLCAAAATLTGCSLFVPWKHLYSGAGTYVKDRGLYQVRLGTIPLDRSGAQNLRIESLGPGWEWDVGFRVEAAREGVEVLSELGKLRSEFVPKAVVKLTLTNERRQTVFSQTARLDALDWLRNRAAIRGEGREYQPPSGGWRFQRFDVGPDEGWGSSFTPRYSAQYILRWEVLEPAPLPEDVEVWLTAETYLGSL